MVGSLQVRQRHVFLDCHVRRCSHQRILKQVADVPGTQVFLLEGDVLSVQADPSAVCEERSGDGVEQRGLSCPVAADNRCEIASLQIQAHISESRLLIDCPGIEGFCNMVDLKHIFHDESSYLYATLQSGVCVKRVCM